MFKCLDASPQLQTRVSLLVLLFLLQPFFALSSLFLDSSSHIGRSVGCYYNRDGKKAVARAEDLRPSPLVLVLVLDRGLGGPETENEREKE